MNLEIILYKLEAFALPGFFGGIVLFLITLQKGHYKNNKYIIKFCIEIVGATISAFFLSGLIIDFFGISRSEVFIPFLIGTSWSGIVQNARKKITSSIEESLKGN